LIKNDSARYQYLDKNWLSLGFGFNGYYELWIKENVQPSFRRYIPFRQLWLIHISYLKILISGGREYFTEVVVAPDLQKLLDQAPQMFQPSRVLKEESKSEVLTKLFDMVSDNYVNKVYDSLRQSFHPDHRGDPEDFKTLVEVYEKRKKKIKGGNHAKTD